MKYTDEARAKLTDYLATHELPKGMGTKESACTVAAIRLAIDGTLSDDVPDCMSLVLGETAKVLQDVMPAAMRNSARYKKLIPDMPGTGRDHENQRMEIALDWMWGTVLPLGQLRADELGFGKEWAAMCRDRTEAAAGAAVKAAKEAEWAAWSSARARATAKEAEWAAWSSARARATAAALAAAGAAVKAAKLSGMSPDEFWTAVDPIGLLERMTYLKGMNE